MTLPKVYFQKSVNKDCFFFSGQYEEIKTVINLKNSTLALK